LWGHFDPETGAIELHQDKERGDGDLLNFAVKQTMMNGGTVYVARPEEMLSRNILAAIRTLFADAEVNMTTAIRPR